MGYKCYDLLINGVHWGYNHLLTSWDIQRSGIKRSRLEPPGRGEITPFRGGSGAQLCIPSRPEFSGHTLGLEIFFIEP